MAGGIKGITIEIGGDTTKLGKALTDVNNKSRDLQKELKGVNTLLKMDPGNVTLLTQKQDLLTKSIDNTKEKLETLKEAQKQAQAQFEKGEITEEQYRDLQREIIATEQKLEKLTDEFKEFGSVSAQQVAQAGEKVQEVGGKVTEFGKGMSVVSAGTGAVLAGSIAAFKELDSGYDTIITKTGATGEALEELNAVADNIFGSMPTDMDTVSVAVGEINTRFGYTGEKLETLSKQFIQFAEINGVDLNNSIGTVDKVLEQFNLTGEDASGVLDLITLKAQQTGIGADTLMESIQKNGATFKDMGIGVNEAIVLMSQFEANGVNVETALKGLQKATNEYAKDGLSMEESLSKTIDSIKNAKTDTEALALAQEVFGTKGANEMAKAIREGRISVDDLSSSMEDYAGVVSSTYEGTLDPIDQGTVAMNNLKLAGSELGGALQTTFAPILTELVEKLKQLVSRFTNLSPGMRKTIVIILSIVTALGPLILIIGQLITSVGTIMTFAPKLVTAFNGVKTAFSALGSALAANPIGIVIAAVAALVAAFIYLWNNCEGFRNFWINLWEGVKNAFKAVVDWIVNAFTSVVNWFKENWQAILLFLVNPFAGIAKYLYDHCEWFRNLFDGVVQWFKNLWASISTWFKDLWNGIYTNVIQPVAQWFKDLWNGIVSAFHTVIDPWVEIVRRASVIVYNEIIKPIADFFVGLWNDIVTGLQNAWNWIVNLATTIAGWVNTYVIKPVANFFVGLWNGITTGVTAAINAVKSVFSTVANWVNTTVIQPITGFFSKLWDGFKTGASNAWEGVKSVFAKVGEFFGSVFNTVKEKILSVFAAGGKIFSGIKDGIVSTFKTVVNAIIKGLNKVITIPFDGLNTILNKISKIEILGVSPFSWLTWRAPLPQIPLLARGGIVRKATNAIIGEDGAEAIIPLENNTEWLDKVAQRLDRNTPSVNDGELLSKLDRIYDRLNRLQVVLNNGVLVGEILDDIDAGLADKQLLNARGV